MTSNKGSGPQFGETVYISEGNGTRKVKFNAQVAINMNSDSMQYFFLNSGWQDSAPNSNFSKLLELSESNGASKLILGLQVNIDEANIRKYHVTR